MTGPFHPLPPRRLRAWLLTRYRVDAAEAVVGRRSRAMDGVLRRMRVRQGVLLGAGNPGGRRMPEGWNLGRHRALLERARRLCRREGEGVGRGWSERHLLLGCPVGRARSLARVFGQGGFVVVRSGRRAELVLLAGPTLHRPASGTR